MTLAGIRKRLQAGVLGGLSEFAAELSLLCPPCSEST